MLQPASAAPGTVEAWAAESVRRSLGRARAWNLAVGTVVCMAAIADLTRLLAGLESGSAARYWSALVGTVAMALLGAGQALLAALLGAAARRGPAATRLAALGLRLFGLPPVFATGCALPLACVLPLALDVSGSWRIAFGAGALAAAAAAGTALYHASKLHRLTRGLA